MTGESTEFTELYDRGVALYQAGQRGEAVQLFQQVVARQPDCSPAWNNLGVAAFQDEKHSDAEIYFRKACDTDPENVEALENLADLYYTLKKFLDGIDVYTRLTQKDPNRAEFYAGLGDCYAGLATYESALFCYKEASKHQPESEVIQRRILLVNMALAPLPFAVADVPPDGVITIGIDGNLDRMTSIFSPPAYQLQVLETPLQTEKYFFAPPDIIIAKDDPSLFLNNAPAKCRILILSDGRESSVKEIQTNQIDYIFCYSEQSRNTLLETYQVQDYQLMILPDEEEKDPASFRKQCLACFEEMILHYSRLLELRDCLEQMNWLLETASRQLPDSQEISTRHREMKSKISHLSDPGIYKQVYEESAKIGRYQENVTDLTRYKWLLCQLMALPCIHSVVDVGCHMGEFDFALSESGYSVAGVDVAEENIAEADRRLQLLEGGSKKLEFHTAFAEEVETLFSGRQFDAALIMEVLEHVPDVNRVLAAVENIVAPDGYIFITVPQTHLETLYRLIFNTEKRAHEHVRRFSPENIPVYFHGKPGLVWEEITATDQMKWLGIRYQVPS